MNTKPLPCSCCPRPFAELVRRNDGTVGLLVKARHDSGERHYNVLTLAELIRLIREFEAQAVDKT